MAVDILMPKLSDNMEEGLIIRWLKGPGDAVEKGEPLVEVETEKADVEVEATESGTLGEITVAEGSRAAVGAVLAVMAPSDGAGRAAVPSGVPDAAEETAPAEDRSAAVTVKAAEAGLPSPAAPLRVVGKSPPVGAATRVSPVARRLATDNGIDLESLTGSGPGGRIVKRDVEAAVGSRTAPAAAPARREQPVGKMKGELAARADGASVIEKHSRMRLAIARRMYEAKRDIPHFYVGAEIDMTEAVRLRRSLVDSERIEGITVTHLLLRALAIVLEHHPRVNASYHDHGVELHGEINLGIIVAVDDGIVVPVLHGAQRLTLREIVEGSAALIERARRGKVHGEDLLGGTFSISNIGMIDVDDLTAIINPPQAAILAVAAIKQRPVVRGGEVAVADAMRVSLSCDHRVLNGVEAGRFLAELKQMLEQPAVLLLED
jgi:pyruvate dehydrogenase E2 component (dihydrolipoamide acetyltransferase)